MGLRDRIKDTLRRVAASPQRPPPPARPVPRYRDAERTVELVEQNFELPKVEAPPVEAPFVHAPAQPSADAAPPLVAPAAPPEPAARGEGLRYTIRFINAAEGIDATITVGPDDVVLDAGERAGLALPYSCRSGGCTSCTGKIVGGTMEMGEQYTLEPEHLAEGYVLLCCARATSDVVVQTHQAEELP